MGTCDTVPKDIHLQYQGLHPIHINQLITSGLSSSPGFCFRLLFLLWNSTTSTGFLLGDAAARGTCGPGGALVGVTAAAHRNSLLSSMKKLKAPFLWPLVREPGGDAGSAARAAGGPTSLFLFSVFCLLLFCSASSSVSPVCSNTVRNRTIFGFSYHHCQIMSCMSTCHSYDHHPGIYTKKKQFVFLQIGLYLHNLWNPKCTVCFPW